MQVTRHLTTHSTRAEIELLSSARLGFNGVVCRRVNSGVGLLTFTEPERKLMTHKSPIVPLAAVFLLWLGLILGCTNLPQNKPASSSPGSSSSTSSSSPSEPPLSITALALANAYEDNEVAADQKYNGKTLLVTGKIGSIDTILDHTSVTLKGKDLSIVSVQCFVGDSQKNAVAALHKGQTITVQGTCDGKGLNVEIKDCVVK